MKFQELVLCKSFGNYLDLVGTYNMFVWFIKGCNPSKILMILKKSTAPLKVALSLMSKFLKAATSFFPGLHGSPEMIKFLSWLQKVSIYVITRDPFYFQVIFETFPVIICTFLPHNIIENILHFFRNVYFCLQGNSLHAENCSITP